MLAGWKTLIFNICTAVLGVMMSQDWVTLTNQKTAGYIVLGMSIANMVLRTITATPVGSSTPKS